ncbi:MAG: polyhydroxyalkanoate synthesis regulator DNA-binding domain-containing protein [Bdellovibrionales bacterium]
MNINPTNPVASANKNSKVKIIKRYQNRKLYDTQQSCYVTLDDIAKMIRASEEVMVIDNKTKRDITAATLTQIIFEAEKKAGSYAPLNTLRDIIQNQDGSMSGYLAKLGAFDISEKITPAELPAIEQVAADQSKASYDDLKSSLDQRINNAGSLNGGNVDSYLDNDDITPELPNSNKTFDGL